MNLPDIFKIQAPRKTFLEATETTPEMGNEASKTINFNKGAESGMVIPEIPIAPIKKSKLPPIEGTNPSVISNSRALNMAERKLEKQSTFRDSNSKSLNSSSISINISQWNARSVHSSTKINYLRSLPADIIAIQEIWQRQCNVLQAGREIDIIDRAFKRGGGTASICMSPISIQVLKKHFINKDSSAVKLRIKNQYMWLINIYHYQGTSNKIQKLFGKIRKFIPMNEWKIICIIGDFNVDITKETFEANLIKSLCKQIGLIIHTPNKPSRGSATIDFMITGPRIIVELHQVALSPSDHNTINWNINISSASTAKPKQNPR